MLPKHISSNIEKLCSTLSLKPENISERMKVSNRIYQSLRSFYPDCRLLIYGSTLNGYGTTESDLDLLFIPSPDYNAESCCKNSDKKEVDEMCPTVYDVSSGKVAKEELLLMDREAQLCFLRRVLRRDKSFQMILFIRAKCPIIRFKIPSLQISCDISCGSSHVVSNSQLLRFYNQIDDRLQPLVITLRHWGKSLGFIQSGVLSSYAMTLLVVFFLQNVEPPVLPPVKYLQEQADSPVIEDGWNVAFSVDLHKLKNSQNTMSLGELFREFFCFCKEFDFSTNVVCPSSGKNLPISNLMNATDSRLKEFVISPMCIQDPFLLSFNTSRNLKMHLLLFFKQAVFLAVKIIDEMKLTDNFDILFIREEYTKLCQNNLSPPMTGKSISFPVVFNLSTKSALEKLGAYKIACDALVELLQYGLWFDCEVVDKGDINLEDTDNHYQFLKCIQCAIYNRTFVGRNKLKDEEISTDQDEKQFENPVINKEYTASKYLIQQNPLITSPEPFFWFYCDVYFCKVGTLENLIIVLTPLTESKERKSIFAFLQSFIEKSLPKLLSDF